MEAMGATRPGVSGGERGETKDALEYYNDVSLTGDGVCGLSVDGEIVVSPEHFVLFCGIGG